MLLTGCSAENAAPAVSTGTVPQNAAPAVMPATTEQPPAAAVSTERKPAVPAAASEPATESKDTAADSCCLQVIHPANVGRSKYDPDDDGCDSAQYAEDKDQLEHSHAEHRSHLKSPSGGVHEFKLSLSVRPNARHLRFDSRASLSRRQDKRSE